MVDIPTVSPAVTDNDTNISIRATKRFAAWFRLRGDQENLTASKLGRKIIQEWIDRGSPMLDEDNRKEPLHWDPAISWEKIEAKKSSTSEPMAASPSHSGRRR